MNICKCLKKCKDPLPTSGDKTADAVDDLIIVLLNQDDFDTARLVEIINQRRAARGASKLPILDSTDG